MTDDPQAMTDKGPRTAEIVHDPYGYRVRIAVPEDHAPDGTVARWTADASAPVGYPYTYSTIGVSVYVDFAGDDEDTPEKRGYRQGIAAARAAVEGLDIGSTYHYRPVDDGPLLELVPKADVLRALDSTDRP